jgi:hypothetical protein
MAKKLGSALNFCRNTATFGSPTFPVAACVKDVKLDLKEIAFDSSDRASSGDTVIPCRYEAKVTLDAIWDAGTFLTAVRTAFLAGSSLLGAVLDGATSARGIHGEWAVTEFPIDAPLQDGQKITIGLQPHGQFTNAMVFVSGKSTTGADSAGTKKLGTNAVVYDGSAAITRLADVKFSLMPGALFDSSDRSTTFNTVIPTRFKYSAEASVLWDPADAQTLDFWTKFIAGNPITLYFLDGTFGVLGTWGLYGDWAVTDFPIDGKLSDGQRIALKFEPHGNGSNAVAPFTDPGP